MRIIGENFILNAHSLFFNTFTYLENKVRNIVAGCFKVLKMNTENPAKPLPKVTFKEKDGINANKSVYVFGDIHGELDGFWENLLNAELIDTDKKWIGKSCIMVQMGDVIDRGVMSEEAWDYLKELQMQAEKTSGTVVRLTGNHELMVLEGNFHYAHRVIKNPEKFAEKVQG